MSKKSAKFIVGDMVEFHIPEGCKYTEHPRPRQPGPHRVEKVTRQNGYTLVWVKIFKDLEASPFDEYWFRYARKKHDSNS